MTKPTDPEAMIVRFDVGNKPIHWTVAMIALPQNELYVDSFRGYSLFTLSHVHAVSLFKNRLKFPQSLEGEITIVNGNPNFCMNLSVLENFRFYFASA